MIRRARCGGRPPRCNSNVPIRQRRTGTRHTRPEESCAARLTFLCSVAQAEMASKWAGGASWAAAVTPEREYQNTLRALHCGSRMR